MRKAGLAGCIAKVEELERPIKSKGNGIWERDAGLLSPQGSQPHTCRLRYFGTYRHL